MTSEFAAGLRELNAQCWVLLALCANGAGIAVRGAALNGFAYEKSLQVLLPYAGPYLKGVRLRNNHMSEDLGELCERVERWLPSYFLVLGKSLAEGCAYSILDVARRDRTTIESSLRAFRARRKGMPIRKALEFLTGAAVRGDFDVLNEVIAIKKHETSLRALSPELARYNQTRNALSHRLGQQFSAGILVTESSLIRYFGTLEQLISLFADLV